MGSPPSPDRSGPVPTPARCRRRTGSWCAAPGMQDPARRRVGGGSAVEPVGVPGAAVHRAVGHYVAVLLPLGTERALIVGPGITAASRCRRRGLRQQLGEEAVTQAL